MWAEERWSADSDDDSFREDHGEFTDGELELFFEDRMHESLTSVAIALAVAFALLASILIVSPGSRLSGMWAEHTFARYTSSTPCVDDGQCRLPSCANSSNFDALVVCGGGQTPSGPPPHVILRLEKALELFFAQEPRPFIITTGRGTWHKNNPRDERGFDLHEASMNAEFLIQHGVPYNMILEENSSMETVGNAFFIRVLHADVLKLRRLAVINNNWHMQRTQHVFEHVFSVPGSGLHKPNTSLEFIQCESGLEAAVEQQRLAKERESVPKFAPDSNWQEATPDLEALHLWLHRQNMAYSVARLAQGGRGQIDPTLARSY